MGGPAAPGRTREGVLGDVVTSPARRAGYERAGHWNADTLVARVASWAASDPGAVAVVDERDRYTIGRVWDDARRHFDEQELATVLLAVASVNLWNRLNAATRQVAGTAW